MSTLVEIRKQFVKLNGRFDLVDDVSAYADNGADFYIQAGSRYLDRQFVTPFSKAKHYESAVANTWYKIFQECRSILDVWVANDEYRKKLEKRDVDVFRAYYNQPAGDIDSGCPTYYTPALLRTHPQTSTMYIENFVDGATTETSKYDYEYNGVMWMPPTDEAIILEVQGLWYSKKLALDADNNYWSVNHPEVLVMAACMVLEMSYRNTEGTKDWKSSIDILMIPVEFDVLEQETSDRTEMEG